MLEGLTKLVTPSHIISYFLDDIAPKKRNKQVKVNAPEPELN